MKLNNKTQEQLNKIATRISRGLSINDVALKNNTSRKTIYRYESGKYKTKTDIIKKLDTFYKEMEYDG